MPTANPVCQPITQPILTIHDEEAQELTIIMSNFLTDGNEYLVDGTEKLGDPA